MGGTKYPAGGGKQKLSMPYFDDVLITRLDAAIPAPSSPSPGQTPIYAVSSPNK